jgi:hypothetical protein
MDASADLMAQNPLYLHRRGDSSRVARIAFQTLPQEILCEIARLAIENRTSVEKLNEVCVSMRRAVNGMRSFWHRFSIGYAYGVRYAFAPIIP